MKTDIQIRNAQLRAEGIDTEKRTAVFVITSEEVDSYETVFRSDGWDFTAYMRNPVVAYNHRTHGDNPDDIIGITEEIWQEGKETLARVRFEEEDVNPSAEKVFRKIQNGTLRMASVGARIHEGHFGKKEAGENPDILYFTRQELMEWSVVTIGSNPSALKRNEESLEVLRSTAAKDIDVQADPVPAPEGGEVKSTRCFFEAQLIVNQNRLVK